MKKRRTYMLDYTSLRILHGIKEKRNKLMRKGIYLKSDSDAVNFGLRKLNDYVKELEKDTNGDD